MTQKIGGPGVNLPLPQNLYPTELGGAAQDIGSNRQTLAGGDAFVVPAGEWWVGLGMYLVLQFLDPITNVWVMGTSAGWESNIKFVVSEGYNVRIYNPLGCPIGAVITNAGSGYVQASTTIAVTGGGGSTWAPIVGGQLALSGGTLLANGAGYGVAPLAMIPPPPPANANSNGVGGIPASGYFIISGGTISGFSFTNEGAGYQSGITITAYPSPFDPNLSTGLTLGTAVFSLAGSGSLTGVLLTNGGAPISNPANITLTVSGVGSQATVTPIMCQTIVTASVTGGGTGFGTVAALLTTVGGGPSTQAFTSPENLFLAGKPRPADIQLTITGTGTIAAQLGTIYDGGFFYSKPNPILAPGMQAGAAGSIAGPTIALTMGNVPDIAVLQPAA